MYHWVVIDVAFLGDNAHISRRVTLTENVLYLFFQIEDFKRKHAYNRLKKGNDWPIILGPISFPSWEYYQNPEDDPFAFLLPSSVGSFHDWVTLALAPVYMAELEAK